MEPGVNPETVNNGEDLLEMVLKLCLSVEMSSICNRKCCGEPPLNPGLHSTCTDVSLNALVEQLKGISGGPTMKLDHERERERGRLIKVRGDLDFLPPDG